MWKFNNLYPKNSNGMNKKEFIQKVNVLLIKQFGIPERNKKLPEALDLLIATILSQNTNDNNSYKAFRNLKDKYGRWEELIVEKRTVIEKEIRVAGLAKQKSEAIKNVITQLIKSTGKVSLEYIDQLSDDDAIKN